VPQAQEYCQGNFSHVGFYIVFWYFVNKLSNKKLLFMQWDNRITTLPGLYLISVGVITPLSSWFSKYLCETHHLRLTNVVLSLSNFVLNVWLTKKIHRDSGVS
jgi:alpha-1,2-glucosyltransferase